MIGIINYGMGNIQSVCNALDYLEINHLVINNLEDFKAVEKLILPGVGAFGMAMKNLEESGFRSKIDDLVLNKKIPILGICLGMQLLLSESSEFGHHKGLNYVNGEVLNFKEVLTDLPVPHIGWNSLKATQNNSLLNSEFNNSDVYFVHSFYCSLQNVEEIAATTNYGLDFVSMLERDHIYGCQFHPEKSQTTGLSIFNNFAQV